MMTKRDKYFLNLATKQALSAPGAGGAYLGAVLVVKGRLLSFGANRLKSHPLQAEFAKNEEAIFLHAETDAISNALRQMTEAELHFARTTLYIVRTKRRNRLNSPIVRALAKPCKGCLRAIAKYSINRTVYTVNETDVVEILM